MIHTLAISHYRSLLNLVIPLGQLNLITGPNGCGKSNLYRALRLLAETAQGGVVNALAHEGGLNSTFWAGPENITHQMKTGAHTVEGLVRQKAQRLRLGFASDEFSYAISLGLPKPSSSAFSNDPEIKRESIFFGDNYRQASSLIERENTIVKNREDRQWGMLSTQIPLYESIFSQISDPVKTPEVVTLREFIRGWRFYDHFRTDTDAPARQSHVGTRTPILSHDGHDLAAALRTIVEIGDDHALKAAIEDAFPGAKLEVFFDNTGRFSLGFFQHGLLRPLSAKELSDGTLRYLLWIAALLTPRPPPLMVLNEPETSLHPDLLPALGRLIVHASKQTQVWVVSHAPGLIEALRQSPACHEIVLEKELGQTQMVGQTLLDTPLWRWPDQAK